MKITLTILVWLAVVALIMVFNYNAHRNDTQETEDNVN